MSLRKSKTKFATELKDYTQLEIRLLVYLEDCLVNKSGRIDSRNMNAEERDYIELWVKSGFLIGEGRIQSEYIERGQGNRWVEMSEAAIDIALLERRKRAIERPRWLDGKRTKDTQ